MHEEEDERDLYVNMRDLSAIIFEGVHGKLDKWKVEILALYKPFVPPQMGHLLVIFSAAIDRNLVTQKHSLKVLIKCMQEVEARQSKRRV